MTLVQTCKMISLFGIIDLKLDQDRNVAGIEKYLQDFIWRPEMFCIGSIRRDIQSPGTYFRLQIACNYYKLPGRIL